MGGVAVSAIITDDYTGRPLAVSLPFYGDDPMHRPALARIQGSLWGRASVSDRMPWELEPDDDDPDLWDKQRKEEVLAWGNDL